MESVDFGLVIETAHEDYTSRTLPRTVVHTQRHISIMKQAHNAVQWL